VMVWAGRAAAERMAAAVMRMRRWGRIIGCLWDTSGVP
jgi:hypothetical protein